MLLRRPTVARDVFFDALLHRLEAMFDVKSLTFKVMCNLLCILRCDRHLGKAPGSPRGAQDRVKCGEDGSFWGVLGLYMRPR